MPAAAGVACANILLSRGISEMIVLDSQGVLHPERSGMNDVKIELAQRTNPRGLTGGLAEALAGADVFLGASGGVVPEELIASMAPGGVVFALSNPDPEIHPDLAAKYAAVVATGRSDFPNQINNVLAFPGVFRGALDSRRAPHHRDDEVGCGRGDLLRRRRRAGPGPYRAQPAGPAGR